MNPVSSFACRTMNSKTFEITPGGFGGEVPPGNTLPKRNRQKRAF